VVGSPFDDDKGSNAGAAYVYRLVSGTWNQIAKIKASDGAASDYFGYAVDIYDNYIVVGSYCDDDKGSSSGSVYIFFIQNNTVSQVKKITAVDGSAYDNFGWSVSIWENYVAVGSYFDDGNELHSGSVYIYILNGESATLYAKLIADDGALYDFFGYAVDIYSTYIIVSAVTERAVYVFQIEDPYINQIAKLVPSDPSLYDNYGYDLAIKGNNIVVGTYADDNDEGTDAGAAYVYKIDGDNVTQISKLLSGNNGNSKYFGYSVDIDMGYVAVGASHDSYNSVVSGAAYLYKIHNDSIFNILKFGPSDGAATDYFGYSISLDAGNLISGAYYDDDKGTNSGSAYIYTNFTSVPLAKGSFFEEENIQELSPVDYALYYNYPNPFNPSTTIKYSLPTTEQVSLKIYNILGQEVITLVDELQDAGYKQAVWNAKDVYGNQVASGIYIYRLQTDKFVQSKKMILLK